MTLDSFAEEMKSEEIGWDPSLSPLQGKRCGEVDRRAATPQPL